MAWKTSAAKTDAPLEKDTRIIGPTESKRIFGFPIDWIKTDDVDLDARAGTICRRNAVGHAFAVPAITRILLSLCRCLEAINMWENPSLPAPF